MRLPGIKPKTKVTIDVWLPFKGLPASDMKRQSKFQVNNR
jgi:hypothetical protein